MTKVQTQTSIVLLLCLLPAAVFANEGLDEHTKQKIIYQAINVAILVAGCVYFLKSKIREMFAQRNSSFIQASQKAKNAIKAAENEHMELRVKLQKLESTAEDSIMRARAEAQEMKKNLILEAETISQRIRHEAQLAAELEVTKAKTMLRRKMIEDAVFHADKQIKSSITDDQHNKLQSEFVKNVEAQ